MFWTDQSAVVPRGRLDIPHRTMPARSRGAFDGFLGSTVMGDPYTYLYQFDRLFHKKTCVSVLTNLAPPMVCCFHMLPTVGVPVCRLRW
jgi:hypothetical protein